jgi:hypothetical protein
MRAALIPDAGSVAGPWLLNANRNDRRKRPELTMRAFAPIAERHPRVSGGGDRPDQPPPLFGAQGGVEGVLDQAVPEQPHLLRPGPASLLLVLLLRHDRRSLSLPGPPLRTDQHNPTRSRPGRPE